MVAMKNATENAEDLIEDLTISYNKVRQSNITREMIEIASGADAPLTLTGRRRLTTHGERHSQIGPGRVIQITDPSSTSVFPAGHAAEHPQRGRDRRGDDQRLPSARSSSTSATTGCGRVAMTTTDGLARGVSVRRHRRSRSRCPVGEATLGRVFDVPRSARSTARVRSGAACRCRSIDRRRPSTSRSTEVEVFETGLKVIDLIVPVPEGRQDRHLRRRRRRQDRHHPGADPATSPRSTAAYSVFAGVGERTPRGQRPHPRDDRSRASSTRRALRLRPDERAARRAPARRP